MILRADATRLPLADKSVDLVLGSPPYCDARTYDDGTLPEGHTVSRDCAEWVEWMLDVTTEALRVSRGAVVWVAFGVTRDRNYWPACEGLMWEWFKRGGSSYRPCYWQSNRIPGSGGDQWFRADVEYVMCFKRPGPLPWTDNTAMGHKPKWAPGGEMSHRLSDGTRRNVWGMNGSTSRRNRDGEKEIQVSTATNHRKPQTKRLHTKRKVNGDMETQGYDPPKIANPGNLIYIPVGGGQIGDDLAHENEAPYPERLAEWFIRSLCPPGGIVLDPFSGSGTSSKVAKATGRKFIACDIRQSQCLLTRRRVREVQTELF